MDDKSLELFADVIAGAITEAIAPRDEKIGLLENQIKMDRELLCQVTKQIEDLRSVSNLLLDARGREMVNKS